MKKKHLFVLALLLTALDAGAQQVINLSGIWDFAIGDTIVGKKGSPLRTHYDDFVTLPGSMLTNGKGMPVSLTTPWTGSLYDSSYYYNPRMEVFRQPGNIKFPFFLTPERHYVGAAWYRKKIYVPKDWRGQRITLMMERPHIETTVWVNGHEAGHQMSLSTPHRYDVSDYIKAGRNNEIVVRVYNGIENVGVGQDSHSVTDQTQGNWNGITGRIELQAQWKKLNIKKVRVTPTDNMETCHVTIELENHIPFVRVMPFYDYYVEASVCPIVNGVPGKELVSKRIYVESKDRLEFDLFGKHLLKPWDEFHPNLYQLTIRAGDDEYTTTFGMRKVSISGRQFYINGRPLFLRGTVENCCFPLTGYPPTDEESWLAVFRKCKEWGLNHVRFHSYCPPDAAFCAADRVGIYLQPEGPSWPNHGVRLRRGQVIDAYLLEESKRIVDEYGHHPSFVMMAAGNEPAGDWVSYCNDWVRQMHDYDSTRVYCGASVGGGWAWDGGSEYHVKGGARGLDWDRHAPSSDDDYYAGIERPRNFKPQPSDSSTNQSPIIAHEQGQWCAFPDLSETSQYTGVYKAGNFDIFRQLLAENGMEGQAKKFLMASGRLQTLCYKYEMERNMRTKDYAGFQLLGLNDYSGQGTALVGPLNVFWREKDYANARQWREFCSPLVVLAKFPKFVYTNSEHLRVPVEAMNALYGMLTEATTSYELTQNDSTIIYSDTLSIRNLPIGKNIELGIVDWPLERITQPSKMTLSVRIGNIVRNHWDFWVYPDVSSVECRAVSSVECRVDGVEFATAIPSPNGTAGANSTLYTLNSTLADAGANSKLFICDSLSTSALEVLRQGGKVLLTAAGRVTLGSDVKQTYLPVFWNTSWFKMRPPHTTGAYIDKQHPLFSHGFPTDDWSNLNWWELLNKAQVMNLMELPASYQPPIQPIDTWHVSRKLGMLIEARVLGGRLLMTTMDISNDLDRRIVARQMRHAIISYIQSNDFQPTITVEPEVIADFFTKQAPSVDMFTKDSPDELKPKLQ